jgi:hypothetical protein
MIGANISVLDHLLPSIQPQSLLELARTRFEQYLTEFYTILSEEHLLVAFETQKEGI